VSDTIKQHAPSALVAVAVLTAALFNGVYDPAAFAVGSIVIWAAVLVGLVSRYLPVGGIGGPAVAAGLFLAAGLALALASIAWASDQGTAFDEGVRLSAYLGLFVLAACTASPEGRRQWITGLTVGLAAVAAIALVSRLQPNLLSDSGSVVPSARSRLSYPVGYWNGLGALLAFAVLLLASAGCRARERGWRAAAVAVMPVALLGIRYTDSRGAAIALALGLAVLVAASPRRDRQLLAAAVGCAGGALAIAATSGMGSLTEGLANGAARSQGDAATAIVVAAVLLTGAIAWLSDGWSWRPRLSPRARVAAIALSGAAILAAVVISDPPARFREFKQSPPQTTTPFVFDRAANADRALGSSGRWQLWGSAVDAFESAPIEGIGIGGFGDWWTEHNATVDLFARDAHSLFMQQLAELGLLGIALLLGFVGAVAAGAWRRLRAGREGDGGVLAAVLAAALVAAAIDWSWLIPAVFGPVVIVAALLSASAPGPEPRSDRYLLGIATAAVAWLGMVAAAIVALQALKLDQSRSAAAEGRLGEAVHRAEEAKTVEPWSPDPYVQLALVEELRHDYGAAVRYIRQGEERDSRDWRLAVIETRLQTKRGDPQAANEALQRAYRLNRRLPVFIRSRE
jgi:hypothetical protein